MASRTQVLEWVKSFRWRDVEASLAATPKLIAYRDDRRRNFLHICCAVNVRDKKLSPADSIRTADVLLRAGIDINQEAFREQNWKATPLWYAVSRGAALRPSLATRLRPESLPVGGRIQGRRRNHQIAPPAWRRDRCGC